MAQIVGKYSHERAENMEKFLKAVGVPVIFRNILASTSVALKVARESDEWIITLSTMLASIDCKFKLGEEFNEKTRRERFKSITVLEGENTLKTTSVGTKNTKITKIYEFNDHGCVLTFIEDSSGATGKRYFKRKS